MAAVDSNSHGLGRGSTPRLFIEKGYSTNVLIHG